MIIHTVTPEENLFSIAKKYAVSPVKIIENNCLACPDRLIPGQKLLILTPTRIYYVRGGDTVSKVCRRFEIKKNALLASNPGLHGKHVLHAGTELAIRYDLPLYGIAAINGYVYESTSKNRFHTMLPYLTYITFGTYKADQMEWVSEALGERKIPLLRLSFSKLYETFLSDKEGFIHFIKNIKEKGFLGITLSPSPEEIEQKKQSEFLLEIKKRLLGMDMLMFQEVEANTPENSTDAADGVVLLYEKCQKTEIPDFKNGERTSTELYASASEVGKTFMELSSFGYDGEKALTMEQIQKIAIKYRAVFENDDKKKISTLDYQSYRKGEKHPSRICFESLDNIKAKLELMHEFGFMGAAVDIGRIPISYIMMLYTMFAGIETPYSNIVAT